MGLARPNRPNAFPLSWCKLKCYVASAQVCCSSKIRNIGHHANYAFFIYEGQKWVTGIKPNLVLPILTEREGKFLGEVTMEWLQARCRLRLRVPGPPSQPIQIA